MIVYPTVSESIEQTTGIVEEGAVEYKNKYLEALEENRLLRIEMENLRKIIDEMEKELPNTASLIPDIVPPRS